MTLNEQQALIGKVGEYSSPAHPGMLVLLIITDVKVAYSTVRVLVTPVAGYGNSWMNFDSLRNVRAHS